MLVLIINAGSSSIKYQLINMDSQLVIAKGLVERIGISDGIITHRYLKNNTLEKKVIYQDFPSHIEGMKLMVDLLTDAEVGVISDPSKISAVGHRVVQGGCIFDKSVLVTNQVKKDIKKLSSLAPLHNPANLIGIEVSEQIFKGIPQVVVFDTAFHQTMPAKAYRYAISSKFYTDYQVRAYGAHGTSHKYVRNEAVRYMGNESAKVITIHLGNGASMTAVNSKGESIDTSMGFTPLTGLVMGTRSGDIDASAIIYMVNNCGVKFEDLDNLLNKQSGMLGMTGASDARDVEKMYSEKNPDAILCLELYAYRVKKYIGAYLAALNGADALVFTAGLGENDNNLRYLICKDLEFFGIKIDEKKNVELNSPEQAVEIQAEDSKIKILVIPTNEELEIANETVKIVGNN